MLNWSNLVATTLTKVSTQPNSTVPSIWLDGGMELLNCTAAQQYNTTSLELGRTEELRLKRKRKEETTQAVARHKNLRAAIYHHQPVADWFRAVRASHACWAIREDTIADY